MKLFGRVVGLVMSFFTMNAFAHPGHGMHKGFSLQHYLIDHGYIALLMMAVFVAIYYLRQKIKNKI